MSDPLPPPSNDARTAKEVHDPLIGALLGDRFIIERRLGAGGMGVVYLGRQLSVDRPVAIKLLPAQLSGDTELVRRFMREAKVVSALSHPNTVTLHDFGQMPTGALYLVMELVAGETLEAHLQRVGRLPVARALTIAAQLLDALEEAHGRGIIHRDIKPANIMLSPRAGQPDFVKLLDFGLARNDEDSTGDTTRTGAVMGTPAYMSPEQGRGHRCDARTDLYSLGVVLFEMVTGERPFSGPSNLALLLKHFSEPAPRLVDRRPDLVGQPGLEHIVARALAKEREERFASAGEMRAALDAVAESATAPRPPPVVPAPPAGPTHVAATADTMPDLSRPAVSKPAVPAPAVSEPPATSPELSAPRFSRPPEEPVAAVTGTPAGDAPRGRSPALMLGLLAVGAVAIWLVWPGARPPAEPAAPVNSAPAVLPTAAPTVAPTAAPTAAPATSAPTAAPATAAPPSAVAPQTSAPASALKRKPAPASAPASAPAPASVRLPPDIR